MSVQPSSTYPEKTPAFTERVAVQPVHHRETLSSEDLLAGRREILISHGDRVYRLRHTSNDKLILTK